MKTETPCRRRTPEGRPRTAARPGRRLRTLLAVGVTLVASAGLAGPASAASGSISGSVQGPGGSAVGQFSVCVTVTPTSSSGAFGSTGYTAVQPEGTYAIGGLSAGSYRVRFANCGSPEGTSYATQYFGGGKLPDDATPVTLSDGGARSDVDATLEPGTSISGHVYGGAGKDAPLSDACVSAVVPQNSAGFAGSYAEQYARTDDQGAYVLRGLAAGVDYRVQYSQCPAFPDPTTYLGEWYDDQPSFQTAKLVTPTLATPAVGVDANLTKASTISGIVRDASGAPITTKDVCVQAGPRDFGPAPQSSYGYATTDGAGRYTMGGLGSGSYLVTFRDCPNSARNDVPEYYGDTRTRSSATLVVLSTGGQRSGIDAQLDEGAQIRGTVTSEAATPRPLEGICVNASQAGFNASDDDFAYGYATTDATGSYAIRGLPQTADGYRVQFRDCSFSATYVSRWFGGDYRYASAVPVKPTASTPATDVDGRLAPGATISGTVTDDSGKTITSGVCVQANRISSGPDGSDDYFSSSSGSLSASGGYSISGLPAGSYDVTASDCGGSSGPRNDLTNTRTDPVVVTAGNTTPGIDFAMRPATTISGTVYAGAGTTTPLGQVCVSATESSDEEYGPSSSFATTGPDGRYTLRQVDPAKRYKVTFSSCGFGNSYGIQYWKDAATFESATPVSSSIATPATGIDAHLTERRAATVITGGPAADAATNDPVATFAFRSDDPGATFECRLDQADFRPCDSPYTTGSLPDGRHGFEVRATPDGSSTPGPTASRSWTVAVGSPTRTSEGDVEAGTPFSSDPDATPSSKTPVVTEITLPEAGRVTLTKEPSTAPSGNGYTVFGQQFDITAKAPDGTSVAGTVATPIALTFRVAASALPTGYDLQTLSVLRNGALAPDCTSDDGSAAPDPCIAGRTRDPDTGDVSLTILTTHLSVWNIVQKTATTTPGTGSGTGTTGGNPAGGSPGAGTTGGSTGSGPSAAGPSGGASTNGSAGGAPAGGGSTGGQSKPPVAQAPALTLSKVAGGRLRKVLTSGLKLPFSCSRACTLDVRITVDGKSAKKLGLAKKATATVVGSAGAKGSTAKKTVAVRFTAKARKALARATSVRLSVAVVVGDGSGATTTTTRTLTLKR